MSKKYDCIVIGGGHSGVEAALAPSRMGCKTLMVNLFFDTIGEMSCNPAIGGVGKGQLVKEIDALGGAMGEVADKTAIQFRQLNASKGPAVRSSRCQSDRELYKREMQRVVKAQKNLDFLEDEATGILVKDGKVCGLKTKTGKEFECKTVVVTAGTFLNGRMHTGPEIISGGRIGEPASVELADCIRDLGFEIVFFKTGTPPRLNGKTIDFAGLEVQNSDEIPIPFSFRTKEIAKNRKLLPCHITYTNEETHAIIQDNMHLSPMYSGQINATGVRYCPSIEDKLKKFSDKQRHQVFLEPEGLDTDVYYPNGISTGLPADVQEKFVRSIKGLENVEILRHGYSIEHGVILPTVLKASLETKKIKGLFFAGQINGSTGYEEAAVQGLMAGANAALYAKDKEPFILGRDEAYADVLIDDLITKGTEEPYRMFTSRVEYRLIVREDNADKRLSKHGCDLGLVSKEEYKDVCKKYEEIDRCLEYLRGTKISASQELSEDLQMINSSLLKQSSLLSDLLKRPEIDQVFLSKHNEGLGEFSDEQKTRAEYEIKYEGFIDRQLKDVDKFKHIEKIKIPKNIKYDEVHGLSIEIQQKLKNFEPENLGQANRISGVTPAAISILMIFLKKKSLERQERKQKEK